MAPIQSGFIGRMTAAARDNPRTRHTSFVAVVPACRRFRRRTPLPCSEPVVKLFM